MTHDEFNAFCATLPAATHVVQWRGAQVWKVGGKVFAIGVTVDGAPAYTFKAGEVAYEILKQEPGLRPAPYLASRGMKWIQHVTESGAEPGLSDADLKDYLRRSHEIVAAGLTKKTRRELGFD